MGTTRRDRTGDEYGIFTVTGPDPDDPNLWGGIWGCCGRYQAMTIKRCSELSNEPPKRCAMCVSEDHQEECNNHEGVTVPGWGYVPALFGDFGRLNANGHETQGWRRKYEWARDDETACAA